MTQAELCAVGFRWTKPSWEQTADRSWILIVPSAMLGESESGCESDPRFDRTQRYYEVYNFDGSWLDQLHEVQLERLMQNREWRKELHPFRQS